jgi:RimJ/RimL family protein N-acetyltransferase
MDLMMEIETDRLFIKLLTLSQLRLWINEISTLEKELNCKYDAEPMEGVFLDIVKNQIKTIENDPKNCLYYSFWFIIRKIDRMVIGSMDFKNIPNEIKEVEIGYGLGKKYEHNGYMTEAVKSFCEWAISQENIKHIIAETEIENIPSQNILKRCGFAKYKQENTLWGKL